MVIGHWSLVISKEAEAEIGHWSLVIGHWGLVKRLSKEVEKRD